MKNLLWKYWCYIFFIEPSMRIINLNFQECNDSIEETFWFSNKPFSEHFLKCFCYWCEEYFNNRKELFQTFNNILWNGIFLWIMKILHVTINANKKPQWIPLHDVMLLITMLWLSHAPRPAVNPLWRLASSATAPFSLCKWEMRNTSRSPPLFLWGMKVWSYLLC